MTDERTPGEILADGFAGKVLRQCRSLPLNVTLSAEDYSHCGLVDLSGFSVRDEDGEKPPTDQGYGTQGMEIICTNADIFGIDVEVYAGLIADGCDPDRLIRFYGRFGFVLQNPDTWNEILIERPHLVRRQPRPE